MQKDLRGTVEVDIRPLLAETGATAMDLTRYGLAQGTAYKLTRGRTSRVQLSVVAILLDFFNERITERKIVLADILHYSGRDNT